MNSRPRPGCAFQSRRSIAAAFVLATLAACTRYEPKPLDDAALNRSLVSPDPVALAQAAAQFRHPRLKPITLDLSKPLTEEQAAVVAALANPDLVAMRAQKQVADAQVFAAGLLPDPQIGVGLDLPVGG